MSAIREVEFNHDYYSAQARKAYNNHYTPESNYIQLKNIYEAVEND